MKPWNELSLGNKVFGIFCLLPWSAVWIYMVIASLLHEDGGVEVALLFASIGVFATWLLLKSDDEEDKGQDAEGDMIPQLRELAQMRELGQLSEAEYAQAKQRLLNK